MKLVERRLQTLSGTYSKVADSLEDWTGQRDTGLGPPTGPRRSPIYTLYIYYNSIHIYSPGKCHTRAQRRNAEQQWGMKRVKSSHESADDGVANDRSVKRHTHVSDVRLRDIEVDGFKSFSGR